MATKYVIRLTTRHGGYNTLWKDDLGDLIVLTDKALADRMARELSYRQVLRAATVEELAEEVEETAADEATVENQADAQTAAA